MCVCSSELHSSRSRLLIFSDQHSQKKKQEQNTHKFLKVFTPKWRIVFSLRRSNLIVGFDNSTWAMKAKRKFPKGNIVVRAVFTFQPLTARHVSHLLIFFAQQVHCRSNLTTNDLQKLKARHRNKNTKKSEVDRQKKKKKINKP